MTIPADWQKKNPVAPIRQLKITHAGEKGLGFDLDGLGQKLASADAQDIRQGIVDRIGLTKADNAGRFVHDVSLSRRGSGRLNTHLDTSPLSHRHHPHSVIARLSVGILSRNAFRTGTGAADATDRIIYDDQTGALYFDADGSGAGSAQVQFATFLGTPTLTRFDFVVF